jgi:hypothetical protein
MPVLLGVVILLVVALIGYFTIPLIKLAEIDDQGYAYITGVGRPFLDQLESLHSAQRR